MCVCVCVCVCECECVCVCVSGGWGGQDAGVADGGCGPSGSMTVGRGGGGGRRRGCMRSEWGGGRKEKGHEK